MQGASVGQCCRTTQCLSREFQWGDQSGDSVWRFGWESQSGGFRGRYSRETKFGDLGDQSGDSGEYVRPVGAFTLEGLANRVALQRRHLGIPQASFASENFPFRTHPPCRKFVLSKESVFHLVSNSRRWLLLCFVIE